jgi:hypothetical protein
MDTLRLNSRIVLIVALILGSTSALFGMGEETKGNQPFLASNYKEWEGIMPVINHPSRVYHTWVNGNESFWFSGDVESLNEFLAKYASISAKNLEVHMKPTSCQVTDWDGNPIAANWRLHVATGIYLAHLQSEGEPTRPTLTVYCDGKKIAHDAIRVPASVKVAGIPTIAAVKEADTQAVSCRMPLLGYACAFLIGCLFTVLMFVLTHMMRRNEKKET